MERAARRLRSPALVAAADVEVDGLDSGCLSAEMERIQVKYRGGETQGCCAGGCSCCARFDEFGCLRGEAERGPVLCVVQNLQCEFCGQADGFQDAARLEDGGVGELPGFLGGGGGEPAVERGD